MVHVIYRNLVHTTILSLDSRRLEGCSYAKTARNDRSEQSSWNSTTVSARRCTLSPGMHHAGLSDGGESQPGSTCALAGLQHIARASAPSSMQRFSGILVRALAANGGTASGGNVRPGHRGL